MMTIPRFTILQHAIAVACVLAISLALHGAFGLTGTSPIDVAHAASADGDGTIILPPILR